MLTDKHIVEVVGVSCFSEHDNLDDAIEEARAVVAKSNDLSGAMIDGVLYSDTEAVFRLSNSRSIRLLATANGVKSSIEYSAKSEGQQMERAPRRLFLQFRSQPTPLPWHRHNILQRRVNLKFLRIAPLGLNVFLYVEHCPPLLFCVLDVELNDTKSLLLSWSDAT